MLSALTPGISPDAVLCGGGVMVTPSQVSVLSPPRGLALCSSMVSLTLACSFKNSASPVRAVSASGRMFWLVIKVKKRVFDVLGDKLLLEFNNRWWRWWRRGKRHGSNVEPNINVRDTVATSDFQHVGARLKVVYASNHNVNLSQSRNRFFRRNSGSDSTKRASRVDGKDLALNNGGLVQMKRNVKEARRIGREPVFRVESLGINSDDAADSDGGKLGDQLTSAAAEANYGDACARKQVARYGAVREWYVREGILVHVGEGVG